MRVDFGVGGVIDLPTSSDMTDHFASVHKKLDEAKERLRPIYRNLIGAGTMPASGAASIKLPVFPAEGRMWNVLQVAVYGTDGHTTLASAVAEVYAGDEDLPSQGDQIAIFSSVPGIATFSKGTIWQASSTDLFARVYGAAAGSPLIFVARVMDYPDAAVESGGVPPLGGIG